MYFLRASHLAILGALLASSVQATGTLQNALQGVLDAAATSLMPGQALQLGWKSADLEFSVASGTFFANADAGVNGRVRAATVNDTFLFGSGSKPYTGSAIMRLVDEGVLGLHDPLSKHIDNTIALMRPTAACQDCPTNWNSFFGVYGSKVTVHHLISMSSGIPDFDDESFNGYIMANRSNDVVSPLDFIDFAAQKPLNFEPGSHVEYSSTNSVLAGLILTQYSAGGQWNTMRTDHFFPAVVRQRATSHSYFYTDDPLSPRLTGPGIYSVPPRATFYDDSKLVGPAPLIYEQNSSILGYTCSNLVAPALDVAKFFWELVGGPRSVVSATSLLTMEAFRPFDFGFLDATDGSYGAGLMLMSVKRNNVSYPLQYDNFGAYMGHGGEVFGYSSANGVFWGLNASMSLVSNAGAGIAYPGISINVTCHVVQEAVRVLLHLDIASEMGCPPFTQRHGAETVGKQARAAVFV